MEILVFLLGGAFGVSITNLYLLVEIVQKRGLSEDLLTDIIYECVSIIFVFSLFNVYMELKGPSLIL